jgi:hypothetical protein
MHQTVFKAAITRIIYYNGINVIIQITETGKVNLAKYPSKWYSISKQQIHSNESLGEEGAVSHFSILSRIIAEQLFSAKDPSPK